MTTRIIVGDVRERLADLPDESVHCVVTSPPYFGLRDYGVAGQIGLEETPAAFVAVMVDVFREVRRVLRSDGTLWLNLGDSHASGTKGSGGTGKSTMAGTPNDGNGQIFDARRVACDVPDKNLIGIPWRVAFALQADGWYLRQDIIWAKPNPMPESVTDRCTKAHEYLFLLSKSARYFYDADAIAEPAINANVFHPTGARNLERTEQNFRTRPKSSIQIGETRNRRSVWTVATQPYSEAHFATFPPALIEPCIMAGCPKGGTVLDPFFGAGTTGLVADRLGRDCIGVELNPEYAELARKRIHGDAGMFASVEVSAHPAKASARSVLIDFP